MEVKDLTLADYITIKSKPKTKMLAMANDLLVKRGLGKAKTPKDLHNKLNAIGSTDDGVIELLKIHPDKEAIMAFNGSESKTETGDKLNCCGSGSMNACGCSHMSADGSSSRMASPQYIEQMKKEEKESKDSYFSENKTTILLAGGLILISALFIFKSK